MKLVLNGLGAHMLAGYCGMMALGKKAGLSARTMLEVVQAGAFSSPMYGIKGEKILKRDFSADFSLALLLKDQTLVLEAAAALGVDLPTEAAICDQVRAAVAAGFGDLDLCGLMRLFETQAGVTVVDE
jgi:3-hydroxyisobutyrate dehydrogenase-like beta-hydroxyacid dehydrogenase